MPIKCVLLITLAESYHDEKSVPVIDLTITTGFRFLVEGHSERATIAKNTVDYYEFTIIDEDFDSLII